MVPIPRRIFELLTVAAAALAGWRLALRAEGSLYESTSPGAETPTMYGSNDWLSNIVVVGCIVIFTALFVVLGDRERNRTITPELKRWLWLGIVVTGTVVMAFMTVLKLHHPDKF